MKPKAIKHLCQLDDAQLFDSIAEGLQHTAVNAQRISSDAELLAEHERNRAAQILNALAEEEAAKFLILLDAVRCQRSQNPDFARQIARFNDHFAKGLYAEYCHIRPSNFGEVKAFTERERQEFYLDGPNEVDFIFRNRILQNRESRLYVDYVDAEGEFGWWPPGPEHDIRHPIVGGKSAALMLVSQMLAIGFARAESVNVIARVWRGASFNDDDERSVCRSLNVRTLQLLDQEGLLEPDAKEARTVAQQWLFPLHQLDLGVERVDLETLREEQRNWNPYL